VPGLPFVEVLGLNQRIEKRLRLKSKIWMAKHGMHFPKNRKVIISLSKDFTSDVIGLEAAVWVALLALWQKRHDFKTENYFFGDFNLQGEAITPYFYLQQVKSQNLALKVWDHLPTEPPEEKPVIEQRQPEPFQNYLCVNFSSGEQAQILRYIQAKEQRVLEPWQRHHHSLEMRQDKILHLSLQNLELSQIDRFKEVVLLRGFHSLVVFLNLCSCGQRSFHPKLTRPACSFAKNYCEAPLMRLKKIPLDSFDNVWIAGNDALNFSQLHKNSLETRANQALIRSRLGFI